MHPWQRPPPHRQPLILQSPATPYPPCNHAVTCHVDFALSSTSSRAQLPALPAELQPHHAERTIRVGPGSILGDVDFVLQRPRSFTAAVDAGGCAWRVTRQAFAAMSERDPASLALLQQIVLRSTSLSAAHALEALDRVAQSS